jgi:hypothetical protein
VVSIVQAAAAKAQRDTTLRYKLLIQMLLLRMSCGRLWKKTLHHCLPDELEGSDMEVVVRQNPYPTSIVYNIN